MRHLALTLLLAAGCGEQSTRPAECKVFVDTFNQAMPQLEAATREVGSASGDLGRLAQAMEKLATAYGALDQALSAQTVHDEQLRLRVEAYQAVVQKSKAAATVVAEAGPDTEVYLINQASTELQGLVKKERTAATAVTDYCNLGT